MFKLRNSKIVKAVCLILASTLFYISCTGELDQNTMECSKSVLANVDDPNFANNFENMLDYARTLDYQENYKTFSEYHQDLFGDSADAKEYVKKFEEESRKYGQMGYENYVNQVSQLSSEVKSYLITYSNEINEYLNRNRPNLEALTNYLDGKNQLLSTSSLCENDRNIVKLYLKASQGYAQYYYHHYFNDQDGGPQLRSCDFFEALGCGLLATIVGIVVTVVMVVLLIWSIIIVTTNPDEPHELTGDAKVNFSVLASLALGIYVGINVYDWCCGRDEVPVQVCAPPNLATYQANGCNEFTYRVSGPSNYSFTTWSNWNTSPSSATTPTPVLKLSVPSQNILSVINANISCVQNGTTVNIFPWHDELIFSDNNPSFMYWTSPPPTTYKLNGPPLTLSVNASHVNLPLNWSVSPQYGYTINTSESSAVFTFSGTGQRTINVRTTNCAGELLSISHTIDVIE